MTPRIVPTRRLIGRPLCVVAAATALVVAASCGGGTKSAARRDSTTRSSSNPNSSVPGGTAPASGTTSLAKASVRLVRVASLDSPTALVSRPGSENLYATERAGTVKVLVHRTDGSFDVAPDAFIDLTSKVDDETGERGMLGLAFSPDGTKVIISYTDGHDDGASVLERYDVEGEHAITSTRVEVLRVKQPFANHNGGNVVFGPDGYLWFGLGDGGGQGDPSDNGQNLHTLLAKILRIDPLHSSGSAPYSIPADNPFADGKAARPEIWLTGVRNPWRFSFDATTADLWIGDVGGSEWEEVDVVRATAGTGKAANLGWGLREGRHDTDKQGPRPPGMIEPIAEYSHDQGTAITGGFVYRGDRVPSLRGAYLYSDYGTSTLRGIVASATTAQDSATIATTGEDPEQIVSFGQDDHRELYVVELTGDILRIDPS